MIQVTRSDDGDAPIVVKLDLQTAHEVYVLCALFESCLFDTSSEDNLGAMDYIDACANVRMLVEVSDDEDVAQDVVFFLEAEYARTFSRLCSVAEQRLAQLPLRLRRHYTSFALRLHSRFENA